MGKGLGTVSCDTTQRRRVSSWPALSAADCFSVLILVTAAVESWMACAAMPGADCVPSWG